MALDQVEELAELVGLCLAAAGLEVEALAGGGVAEDVVAAPDPVELEPEGLGQALGVGEAPTLARLSRRPDFLTSVLLF